MDSDRIDFVLVASSARHDESTLSEVEKTRKIFEENLEKAGLKLEREVAEGGCLTFVKITAPHDVLKKYCEIYKFRMPLIQPPTPYSMPTTGKRKLVDGIVQFWKTVKNYFILGDIENLLQVNKDLKAVYSRNKTYLFNDDDPDFFSPTVRILIVNCILNRETLNLPCYDIDEVGLRSLVEDNYYIAAYPLHDGNINDNGTTRQRLYQYWCQMQNWKRKQPLDEVQNYLGTKIAFYFAWLGFYMRLLLPASIFGILVLFYGLITLAGDKVSQNVCNSNLTMCPTCDFTCDYYSLSENCRYSKLTYLFDNALTTPYAVIMAIWASVFLELWKRYEALLTYRWNLMDYSVYEEPARPQYIQKAKQYKPKIVVESSPVTEANIQHEKKEFVVPFWRVRIPMTILSYTTIVFFIMLVIIALVAVTLYRVWVSTAVHSIKGSSFLKNHQALVVAGSSAFLNLVSIMILNTVYTKVAKYLTELELHRTATQHERALTVKIYMFQFVNYYSSIMYIAFFKGKFVGYPGHYFRLFGARQEECGYGGCFLELTVQLAFIMIGKQILSKFVEVITPKIKKLIEILHLKKDKKLAYVVKESGDIVKYKNTRWIEDFKLADWETVGLFPEYLEMVIQFGFVTLFVPAFPLAPLIAFINNILQIRIDAKKIVTLYRRPVPFQVPGIGAWFNILQFLASCAVLTNGILIAFTSNFIPKLVYFLNRINFSDYIISTLSYANVSDLENTTRPINSSYGDIQRCWYSDLRNPPDSNEPYTPTRLYWQVFIARLVFLVLFQNITYAVKGIIDFWIPDKPRELDLLIREENHLTMKLIVEKETNVIVSNEGRNNHEPENIVQEETSDIPLGTLTRSLETGIDKLKSSSLKNLEQ